MIMTEEKLHGATIKYLYIWDEVYGWIHHTEKDKLEEALKRFQKEMQED